MRLIGGVDTGATTSLLSEKKARDLGVQIGSSNCELYDVEGRKLNVLGSAQILVRLEHEKPAKGVSIPVFIVKKLAIPVDILLGNSANRKLGRTLVWNMGEKGVSFIATVHTPTKAELASGSDSDAADNPMDSSAYEQPVPVDPEALRMNRSSKVEIEDACEPPAKEQSSGENRTLEDTQEDRPDVTIEDKDFVIERHPVVAPDIPEQRFEWRVKWKWKQGVDPEKIPSSSIERYDKKWWGDVHEEQYKSETQEWIKRGFLRRIRGNLADCKFIPWSCAATPEKSTPLRLALDFIPLNEFVRNRAEWSEREICTDELLVWRTSDGGQLLDIRKAYLRIKVDSTQQRFQCVRVNGEPYELTRLAFGLCSAPRILKKVLSHILAGLPIGVFRDDVFIPQQHCTEQLRVEVVKKLAENGFPTKDAVHIGGTDTCKVLGLRVSRDSKGEIVWARREELTQEKIIEFKRATTLSEIAGVIGKIAPHNYPVQGWTRPCANKIRSEIGREATNGWKSEASPELKQRFDEFIDALGISDPVKGTWRIPSSRNWDVWTDASSEAVGYCLCLNNSKVEDNAAISSERQRRIHINVRELDAVVLALTRVYQIEKLRKLGGEPLRIRLLCDNKSVTSWIKSLVSDEQIRLQTMSFVLVDSRLELIRKILRELDAEICIEWVRSSDNIADELTRAEVPKIRIAAVSSASRNRQLKTGAEEIANDVDKSLEERMRRLHEFSFHKNKNIITDFFVKLNAEEFRRAEVLAAAEKVTKECRERGACIYKTRRLKPKSTGQPCHQAKNVNEEVFIDFLKVTDGSGRYVGAFNVMDAKSKKILPVLSPSPPSREGAAQALMLWQSQHGPVEIIRSDRGTEFANIPNLGQKYHRRGAVLHPQSQGLLERAHRELLSCVRIQGIASKDPWHVRYLEAVRVWNSRPHPNLGGFSPNEVMAGLGDPGGGDNDSDAGSENESDFDITDQEGVFEERFEVGDSVLWEGHGQRKDLFSWVPGKVVEVLPRNAYRVESKRGNQSTMIVRTVNGDRLVSGPPATTESAESQQPPESPQIRRSARIAKSFTEKQNEPENQNNSKSLNKP